MDRLGQSAAPAATRAHLELYRASMEERGLAAATVDRRLSTVVVGKRATGPILVRHDGGRLDLPTAHRWVRSIDQRAGLDQVHPHLLRAAFIMAALDVGVSLREVQSSPGGDAGTMAYISQDPCTASVLCR